MTPDTWRRVSDLFSQCVNLPEEEREKLLAQVADPALVREVRLLLASYQDDYLEKPAVEGIAEAWDGPNPQFHAGQSIGRYRIEEKVGRGGMSVVYRALDPDISRPVAIKFLLYGDESATDKKEFFREVQILGGLRQADVVHVYDCGNFEGLPYIVMEFLEGEDLAKAIAADRCGGIAEKLHIAQQLAAAMESVHHARIVHRDLKPANVFVGPSGQIKLMDFGIARSGGAAVNQVSRLIGTPQYVSPEQVKGQSATYLSDIYSYGIVLYELFTGSPAFAGSTAEVLYKIVEGDIPFHTLTNAGLSKPLIDLIRRTTATDPAKRSQDFSSVLAALRQVSAKSGHATASRYVLAISAAAVLAVAIFTVPFRPGSRRAEIPQISLQASVNPGASPEAHNTPRTADELPKTPSQASAAPAVESPVAPSSNPVRPGTAPTTSSPPVTIAHIPPSLPPFGQRESVPEPPQPAALTSPSPSPLPAVLDSPEAARQIAARMQYEIVRNSEDPVALRNFASNYPDHPFAHRALALAHQLEIRAAAPAEISDTLRRYAEAFSGRNIDAVTSLRLLSAGQRSDIVRQFAQARKIEMTFVATSQPEFVESISATLGNDASLNAVIQCRLVLRIFDKNRDLPSADKQTPVHLKKTPKGWVITSIK
jgi:serine/threonine protein kinase